MARSFHSLIAYISVWCGAASDCQFNRYEYEVDRLAIDLINGGKLLRQWVDDPQVVPDDLEALAWTDEAEWMAKQEDVMLYR